MLQVQGVAPLQQALPGAAQYESWRSQYATSSREDDIGMRPGLIVRALSVLDVQLVVRHAKRHNMAVAIRTGGHQHDGASSTGRDNIQLDLRHAFRSPSDLVHFEKGGTTYIRAGVSWNLMEFNEFLVANRLFVPHGMCGTVCLGGHAQTGGYGPLMRTFGLLGDHITALEYIDHSGTRRMITTKTDPEEFYAWTGGSPGNFGVLTHITLRAHREETYAGARAVTVMYEFDKEIMARLLRQIAEISDNPDFPRNYMLSVSLSGTRIWVFAAWVPLNPGDKPDEEWFARVSAGGNAAEHVDEPVARIAQRWIYMAEREFDLPYVKRTWASSETKLSTNGWASWVAERVDEGIKGGCELMVQIVPMLPGPTAHTGTTAYSWRDTTVMMSLDAFHEPEKKEFAEKWSAGNEAAVGRHGWFSKQEKRFLWGSFGNLRLDEVWRFYHEDKEKYERLRRARARADPDGTFTPNTFCVPADRRVRAKL